MLRTPRDLEILQLVGKFGQLTTTQINSLIFHSNRSDSPCDAVLLRLYRGKHLIRLGRTLVTVKRGGSGEYVYALGRAGWPLVYTGRYRVKTTIYQHTLDIVDAYIRLVEAERAGRLVLEKFNPEKSASVTIGGQLLQPDAFVRYSVDGRRSSFFLEVDKGSEHKQQLAAMFERYRSAWLNYDESDHEFGGILTLVSMPPKRASERVQELNRILDRLPDDGSRGLFRVETLDGFPQGWMVGL